MLIGLLLAAAKVPGVVAWATARAGKIARGICGSHYPRSNFRKFRMTGRLTAVNPLVPIAEGKG